MAVWGCIAVTLETVIPSDFPTNARNPKTRTRAGASSTQRPLELCLEQTGKGLKVAQGPGSLIFLPWPLPFLEEEGSKAGVTAAPSLRTLSQDLGCRDKGLRRL